MFYRETGEHFDFSTFKEEDMQGIQKSKVE